MKIIIPDKIQFSDNKDNKAVMTLEPLYPGYGITIANAIRRVILSSLPGYAVTAVKIKGVQHEFDTVPEVKEDVVQIISNLKKLKVKLHSDEKAVLEIKTKDEKKITAEDIKKDANVEIIDPKHFICTKTGKKNPFEMEIHIEKGIGYLPIEQRDKEEGEIGLIMIDAAFNPIVNIGYNIENVRVGQMTDHEKIVMNIETDGTIDAETSVKDSVRILLNQFSVFNLDEVENKDEKPE